MNQWTNRPELKVCKGKGVVINYGEGRGGGSKRGQCEVLPLQKKGGGGTTKFGLVLTRVLEVLTVLEGDTKGLHP